MNPLLIIGLAAVAMLALRSGDDDEAGDGDGDGNGNGVGDLMSGEVSGGNGTWKWSIFSVFIGSRGGTSGTTTWRWLVQKVGDASQDIQGDATGEAQARSAAISKATEMSNNVQGSSFA